MLLATTAIAGASDTLEHVPLRWKPTSSAEIRLGNGAVEGFDAVIKIDNFQDVRHDREAIGENLERQEPRPVTTTDDVGRFVSRHMRDLLERAGVRIVDSDGSVTIKGEVTQFFVKETQRYNSTVAVHLTVVDRNGNRLWSGIAVGEASRFGHSYKLDNYYEALSDAVVDVVTKMLHSEGLRKALTVR
jgi:hypothetical protein